jgi:dCTP deaminase
MKLACVVNLRKLPRRQLQRRNQVGVKPDNWIRKMCTRMDGGEQMISPFIDGQVKEVPDDLDVFSEPRSIRKVISYGLSSYGYDCRIADEFKIFTNVFNTIVDPKNFDPQSFVTHKGEYCIVPPNSFVLGRTVEWFRIPRDILVIGIGKSTYARCGIILNVTPFEPEWEGYATLEISNTTPLPAKIYANEGICQVVFFQGDGPCDVSYKDKKGKYQSQQGITLPKV